MRYRYRKPSLKKKLAARTSVKSALLNALGAKAPKGAGWLSNRKTAAYNKTYDKTSKGCMLLFVLIGGVIVIMFVL